jgi:hypothetical protein
METSLAIVRSSVAVWCDMSMSDSFSQKVQDIFSEMAGSRAERLAGDRVAKDVIVRIKALYSDQYGGAIASTLGMHLSDWNSDAAFLVALHLFPERFTDDEIKAGIGMFLIHAPNHIRAACEITDTYVWPDFPESDPSLWEDAP